MAKTQGKDETENAPVDPKTPPPADPKKTPPADPKTPPANSRSVRVICDGTLGTKLLERGAVTSDPEYVSLLEVKGQKKVEEVK
jgi:hypothetical protein